MPDSTQTRGQLQTAFADNTSGAITPQGLRNFVVSVPFNTGAWSNATAYVTNDLVTLGGSTYLCILANTNQTPPNATYWQPVGGSGGAGDLLAANNLSDLANAATARTNLGLGTAAVKAASFFATAIQYSNFIIVDGAFGSDVNGLISNPNAPFQTLAAAIAAYNTAGWTFGVIHINPGTYAQGNNQVIFPNGGWVRGSGMDITILTSTLPSIGAGNACFVPGTSGRLSDMTLNCVVGDNNFRAPFGVDGLDTQAAVNYELLRVKILGETDVVYFSSISQIFTNKCVFRDCWLQSTWDTVFLNDGSDLWYYNCKLLSTGKPNTPNGNKEHNCVNFGFGTLHLFDCDLQAIIAGGFCRGFKLSAAAIAGSSIQMVGGRILTFDPGFNAQDWSYAQGAAYPDEAHFSLTGVEHYNPPSFSLPATYTTGSTPPVMPERLATPLTVTSSAATPYYLGGGHVLTIAANASSLSSNTLTINPPLCHRKLIDKASILNVAVTNSNSSGTAMKLAFNTSNTAQNAVQVLNFVDGGGSGGSGTFFLDFNSGTSQDPNGIVYSPTVATLAANINAEMLATFPQGGVTCTGTTLANLSLNYTGEAVNARNIPLVQFDPQASTGFTCTPANTTVGAAPGYNLGGQALMSVPPSSTVYFQFIYNGTTGKFDLNTVSENIISSAVASAKGDLTGQTAVVASICAFTPPMTGDYLISAWANVTAIATDTLQLEVTYTDETGTAATKILPAFTSGGATLASNLIIATGEYTFASILIRAETGSAITVKTILPTSSGTIAYDVGAIIQGASQ